MSLAHPIPEHPLFVHYPALLHASLLVVGLLYGYSSERSCPTLLALLIALLLFGVCQTSWMRYRRSTPFLKHGVLCLTTLAFGSIWAQWDLMQLQSAPLPTSSFRGIVRNTPQRTVSGFLRLTLQPLQIESAKTILVYLPIREEPPSLSYGDTLMLKSSRGATPIKALKAPSYQHFLIAQGSYATLYPKYYTITPRKGMHSLSDWTSDLQRNLSNQLKQLGLPQEEQDLACTISLGQRNALGSVQETFRNAGAAHLLSVSGFHLVVVLSLFSLLIPCSNKQRSRLLRWAICLAVAWGFTLMTGFAAPTVRAATMYTIYSFGELLFRPQKKLNTLAISAIFLLIYHPGYIFDIGFQLSYTALISILLYQPFFVSYATKLYNPIIRYLYLSITVCLSAQILTIPLVLYHFGTLSTLFLWSNIPLMLLATLVIPCCLAYALLAGIGIPIAILGDCVRILTHLLYQTATLFNAPEGRYLQLQLNEMQAWGLSLLFVGIYGTLFYFKKKHRILKEEVGYIEKILTERIKPKR